MKPENLSNQGRPAGSEWPVFVGFDDLKARERASEVCDFMTRQFRPDIEFELHFCDFSQLPEADYRKNAISKAAEARVVIIARSTPSSIELPLIEWMEGLCAHRHGREGALVALIDPGAPEDVRDAMDAELRHLAHRSGLDYLTHAPNCRCLEIPGDTAWAGDRAGAMGTVLEKILQMPCGPTLYLS